MWFLKLIKSILTGDFLIRILDKHYIIILFFFFYSMIYIANNVELEKKHREVSKLKYELRNVRSEYINSIAEIMNLKRLSTIKKNIAAQNLDLKEATEPAFVINN